MIPRLGMLTIPGMIPMLTVGILLLLSATASGAQEISAEVEAEAIRVLVYSDPPGGRILLDSLDPGLVAPDTLVLSPGREYRISVEHEGYEPLGHILTPAVADRPLLEFILRPLPPEPPLPEELGMSYELLLPLLPESGADQVRDKFSSLAEVFLIFPLGQGVIAKIAFSEDDSFPSDQMFYGGAGLVVGTFALSRILYSRKLKKIRQTNEYLKFNNDSIRENNLEVDRAINGHHAERVILWQKSSALRGHVISKTQ